MDHDTDDDATTVARLLSVAHVAMSDDEFGRFVRVYPALRAQADRLYAPEFAAEELALGYDPTIGFD